MVDWGFIAALSIGGIALLVAAVVWGVWLFRQALPKLKRIAKAIVKHLRTYAPQSSPVYGPNNKGVSEGYIIK